MPRYLFHSADELSLCIPTGRVLDEEVEAWLDLLGGFIARKTSDRPLTDDHLNEVRQLFGSDFDRLDSIARETLNIILVAEMYSKEGGLNAKQVSRLLKNRLREEYQRRGEDEFYRAIRYRVERLAPDKRVLDVDSGEWTARPDKMLSIRGSSSRPLFRLNRSYQQSML